MTNSTPTSPQSDRAVRPRGRPREFDIDEVVEAAKEQFWERGYQGSTLADLEVATGLNRSSLYQAFGTKEALFARALDAYIDGFMEPRLAGMRRPGAGPGDIVGFFRGLATLFRADDAAARRGCLWVNSLAEFGSAKPPPDSRAVEYRHLLTACFANALSGTGARGSAAKAVVDQRSRVLTASTFGIWLTTRIEPAEAVRACHALVAEITSWGLEATTERR